MVAGCSINLDLAMEMIMYQCAFTITDIPGPAVNNDAATTSRIAYLHRHWSILTCVQVSGKQINMTSFPLTCSSCLLIVSGNTETPDSSQSIVMSLAVRVGTTTNCRWRQESPDLLCAAV